MIRRALIIESDPSLNRLLNRVLTKLGWRTIGAAAFDNALDAYETGRYDLVLCEGEFDGDGGLVLARAFRRCEPSLGIVLMCGTSARMAEGRSAGFVHVLRKPFTVSDLRRLVKEATLDASRHSR